MLTHAFSFRGFLCGWSQFPPKADDRLLYAAGVCTMFAHRELLLGVLLD
jgi:hypothetical protein